MPTDLNVVYTEMKFWLPFFSIAGIAWKARNAVTGWADKLLNNHLAHMEKAVVSTEAETKTTNSLLRQSAEKLDNVQLTLTSQHDKQLQVWNGVLNTLAVLEDRTRSKSGTPRKRK